MALTSLQPTPIVQAALSSRLSAASSRASSQARQPASALVVDEKSDHVTSGFVKHILCPSHSQHGAASATQSPSVAELLPPLTSSNEIDLQLYAFIALIVKECVQSWYMKFSPDQVFVDEIIHIIAHCTRGLEERARKTDTEILVLDDIPILLDAHLSAYRSAYAANLAGATGGAEHIYHALRPHPALDCSFDIDRPVDDDEPESKFLAYCHLLGQGLLAVLLPPGDLQNPCLRALVSEVSADLVIGNFIGTRFCESLFIYDSIRKATDIIQPRLGHSQWAIDLREHPKDRLSRFGLLSSAASAVAGKHQRQLSDLIILLFHYFMLATIALKWTISAIASVSSLPARAGAARKADSKTDPDTSASPLGATRPPSEPSQSWCTKAMKPVIQYRVWNVLAHFVCLNKRMPWAMGILSLVNTLASHLTNAFSERETIFDRLLAYYILTPIFPLSKHLPNVLLNLRLSLFPGNAFPPGTRTGSVPPLDPVVKAATTARAQRAAAFAILNCIPRPLARIYLSTSAPPTDNDNGSTGLGASITDKRKDEDAEERAERIEQAEIEAMVADIQESILDPFSNEYMNRHLVLAVLELVVTRLVPELGMNESTGKSVTELLAERGVDVEDE